MRTLSDAPTGDREELLGYLLLEQDKINKRLLKANEDTSFFANLNREIGRLYEDFRAVKSQFEKESTEFVRLMMRQLAYIKDQQRQLSEGLIPEYTKICSDFNDLFKITRLQEAYEASKAEVSRRSR